MATTSVYLVDDVELLRRGLQIVIDGSENLCFAGAAADARTAINQAKQIRPDVIIMDIGLPDMDGIAATSQIKEGSPQSRVIILSGHDDMDFVFRAIAAGASAYCLKDSATNKLELAIKSVMSGAFWLDDRISGKVVECVSNQSKKMMEKQTVKQPNTPLSARELEVVQAICDGLQNKEISKRLNISVCTVRTHIVHIAEKLDSSSRTEIALKATRLGLVS